MSQRFHSYLLDITQAKRAEKAEVLQELWSGYGDIARYHLLGAEAKTVIVKHMALNKATQHPRGWNTPLSHQRKVTSYEVETRWYEQWSTRCDKTCRIPKHFGTFKDGDDRWLVMEDLDHHYPVRKDALHLEEGILCLRWLAQFHATFMQEKPLGLWQEGTYWHLDTRPDELERMEEGALKSAAGRIDQKLKGASFQTIIHGDAKVANFCFSSKGDKVAAVDFQYVGGGCGMKDVAYFLGSAFTAQECERHEPLFLSAYFDALRTALKTRQTTIDVDALETEWRGLYPYACADFLRFLLGWSPAHYKVNEYYGRHAVEVIGRSGEGGTCVR